MMYVLSQARRNLRAARTGQRLSAGRQARQLNAVESFANVLLESSMVRYLAYGSNLYPARMS
jgi:hypothetical protein